MAIKRLIDVPAEESGFDKARRTGREYDKAVVEANRKKNP